MNPINKCVFCQGNVLEQKVTEIIRGCSNTASLTINTLVCKNCGERYYNTETIRKFESIKTQLETEKTEDLICIGKSFEVS